MADATGLNSPTYLHNTPNNSWEAKLAELRVLVEGATNHQQIQLALGQFNSHYRLNRPLPAFVAEFGPTQRSVLKWLDLVGPADVNVVEPYHVGEQRAATIAADAEMAAQQGELVTALRKAGAGGKQLNAQSETVSNETIQQRIERMTRELNALQTLTENDAQVAAATSTKSEPPKKSDAEEKPDGKASGGQKPVETVPPK